MSSAWDADTGDPRLAAILAADVVGYSRQVAADEASMLARLRALRVEVVDPFVTEPLRALVETTADAVRTHRAVQNCDMVRGYVETSYAAKSWSAPAEWWRASKRRGAASTSASSSPTSLATRHLLAIGAAVST